MTISVTRIKKQIDTQYILNEYPAVSFIERGEEFNVKNKLKIKVSQDNQYINFLFIVPTKDGDDIKLITETYSVNKFEIAERYKLDSPTVLNSIPFYFYIKGKNIFISPFEAKEIHIDDAVLNGAINITISYVNFNVFPLLDISKLVNEIIETSVWEFLKN